MAGDGPGMAARRASVPRGREERKAEAAARLFTCSVCSTDKTRDSFWQKDYYNRNSPRAGLVCKTCNPTPPEERERKRGRPARNSSAPPSV